MLRTLFGRRRHREGPVISAVDAGLRIYAIGDIHGRLDLLHRMAKLIAADLEIDKPSASLAVFLGDYVDRGPSSRGVVDWLLAGPGPCDSQVFLRGNHEAVLLDFLDNPGALADWSRFGGLETLFSYGVQLKLPLRLADFPDLQKRFAGALPESHRDFLKATRLSFTSGGYFFVHAGVRPRIALGLQKSEDLLWIRDEFLVSPHPAEKTVVHGHTPVAAPELLGHRINVDTGACLTGKLSCVVLENSQRRILMT